MKYLAALLVLAFLCLSPMNAAEVKSTAGGRAAVWSANSSWSTAGVPQPGDNVTITDGDTITIDIDVTIANLTVGTSTGAVLQTQKTGKVALVANGNIIISKGSTLRAQTSTSGGDLVHSFTLTGNFNSAGAASLDLRAGTAGSTAGVINLVFTGSTNSTFTTNPVFNASTNELNGMTINKSGTGKVILGSNVTFTGGSSSGPLSQSIVYLTNGVIETGPYILIHNSTTQANITGASSKSYIVGALGRGISSSSTGTREFPVGDANGYRPVRVRTATSGGATGHFVIVRTIKGDANTGSSTLTGGIDKVSAVRYYEIKYGWNIAGATSMSFDKFSLSYGIDDGVGVKNTDLRLAYSTDKRVTWKGFGQSVADTTFATDTLATADSLAAGSTITIDSTQSIYVALARATGTTTNTLVSSGTAVKQESTVPGTFALEQNFPNPFNPSTTIKFSVGDARDVRLTVYDLLGRNVATLVNEHMQAGSFAVQWNASAIPSGVYFYRLEAGNYSIVKKLTLMK